MLLRGGGQNTRGRVVPILKASCSSVLTALSSSSSFADRERRRGILLAEAGRVTTTGVSRGEELVDLQRQIQDSDWMLRYNEFLPAATKLGQGNIFTSVCLSTGGRGWVGIPACLAGQSWVGGYPSMPCRSVLGG